MGKPISYFANYHGRENAITNYCGLMLKMIYDSNPNLFADIMASILADEGVSIDVGAKFSQQVRREESIPDIHISQSSFNVFFENKTRDWFHTGQLIGHINSLNHNQGALNILVLLCSEFSSYDVINEAKSEAKKKGVHIAMITYEDFLNIVEKYAISEFLSSQLSEFRNFLDKQGLLPNWKYCLDVVNCAGRPEEIETDSVYICPDTGGPYSHKRAQYFGAYKDKKVHHIYTIDAVLSVSENCSEIEIKWKNNNYLPDDKLKRKAKNVALKYRKQEVKLTPQQVFILSNAKEVTFDKNDKGGMWGTKVYFETIAKDCQDIDELVSKINNRVWEDFKD